MLYALLILWAGGCAWQDARQKRIANYLTFSCMAMALFYLLIMQETVTASPPAQAIIAVLLVLILMLPGYVLAKIGAGDIKMLLGVALASNAVYTLMCIIVAGVMMAVWLAMAPGVWPRLPVSVKSNLPYLAPENRAAMPYAPFLFLGLLLASAWQVMTPG